MLVEICASTYQSAINAQKGGADRIELCENLSIGGVTPKRDLLIQVVEELSIPVNVLIRPRGGDFVYTDFEFNKMLSDIEFCKSIGCNSIVSGILNKNNTLDIERTKQLIEVSKPMHFTFHRAFDDVSNTSIALQELIDLEVNHILTSGQAKTAIEGLDILKQLKYQSNDKLTILVGGGIRSSNALEFKQAGFTEIHSSAITYSEHSDLEEIKRIVKIASS